ncbi:MAG TPA: TonB family protein [Terracidiphilus sp.]|nr:TonB family protein [Terracidiphilus sp.]
MKSCPVCDTAYPDQHKTCPTDGAVLIVSTELEPGRIVRGKYRILRKLGQGGMGVVYLAEHMMLGGQIALKFLAVELSRNLQFVKRFRNEARAAYQLRHPNIVEVADLDQDEDGSLFIAMEYVGGPSLRLMLRQIGGPLPVPRALEIARGIASGLGAAHARGAIHRDIKPENILLAHEPDGSVQAKVLDFGIAAMTDSITNMSRTHGLLLTPEYAAPEQWRGVPANELDGRTDLYALGGVLYEMLTGRKAFHAVNPEGWMFQHLQGQPEPLETVCPAMERDYPGLNAVVMRLLARERENRFASAAAFLEALALKSRVQQPAPFKVPDAAVPLQPSVLPTPVAPPRNEQRTEPDSQPAVFRSTFEPASEVPASTGKVEETLFSTLQPRPAASKARVLVIFGTAAALLLIAVSVFVWYGSGHRGSPGNGSPPPEQQKTTTATETHPTATTNASASTPETVDASAEKAGLIWTDRASGLMWTKKSSGNNLNWNQAQSYCRSTRVAGHSDWRLPSIAELQALLDSGDFIGTSKFEVSEPWLWSYNLASDATGQRTATVFYSGFGGGQENVPIENQYCAVRVRRAGRSPGERTRAQSQTASAATAPTPNPARGIQRVQIGAGVAQGRLLQATTPVYPPIAKAMRISGTVVLQATISRSGSISEMKVASGPPMLRQSALDAVKTWRYRPYLLNGRPVEVDTTINVVYTLTN